jgi:hypothetical protein
VTFESIEYEGNSNHLFNFKSVSKYISIEDGISLSNTNQGIFEWERFLADSDIVTVSEAKAS